MNESVEEHYRSLLELPSPWQVSSVEADLEGRKVSVRVGWPRRTHAPCPQCGKLCPVHDRLEERSWRHLSVMQYELELRCALPRSRCPEHGTLAVRTPWAEPGSRYTFHFESWAIEVMQASRSLGSACSLLSLHWSSAQLIIDAAVERGLARRDTDAVTRVGLDEKSFRRGQSYVSLMTDLDDHRALEVVEGRKASDIEGLWAALPGEQREKVVAAAMDMGAPFIAATTRAAPQAEIVHDRFHVSKPLGEAVDKTRREESAKLAAEGDDTLKGSRHLWLHGVVPEKGRERFEQLLEINLKTSKAWLYKEQMVEFWECEDAQSAAEFFGQWHRSVMRSRIPAMKRVARSLKEHLSGLLSYFRHRITNALTEGFNSKIQAIRADARGFRSFANYRARLLFCCGRLNLYPEGYEPQSHTKA